MKKLLALLALLSASSAHAALSTPDYAEMGIPKNYITNGGAERGTTGFKTYANTAQATPVNGTGGSPTHVTISRTTSSPLSGTASLLITNAGSTSAQGEGVSYAFTIDSAQQSKSLGVSFSYSVNSGTFVAGSGAPGTITDSDLEVYLYDVTNSTVIQPAGYILTCGNVGTQCRYQGNFQAASNSTSYRLIWHVPTTHTAVWSVKVDDVVVSPVVRVYGSPVTDWQTYTLTITGATTNPTFGTLAKKLAYYRRVGDSVLVRFELNQTSAGTAGSGEYRFSLPTGLVPDTTKVSASSGNAFQSLGSGYSYDNGNLGAITVVQLASDGVSLVMASGSSAIRIGSGTSGDFSHSAVQMGFEALVPILGWSSTVQMSQDADPRVVALNATGTGSGQTLNSNVISYIGLNSVTTDTHGAFTPAGGSYTASTGTWTTNPIYTIPVSGWYSFDGKAGVNTTASNNVMTAWLYVNGSAVKYGRVNSTIGASQVEQPRVSYTAYETAGSTVAFLVSASVATTLNTDNGFTNFNISRVSGSSAIAPTDSVSASYSGISGGQSFSNGAGTTVTYDTKLTDTTGSMNAGTGIFTAPIAGTYTACGYGNISSTSLTSNSGFLAVFIIGPSSSPKVCSIPFAQGGIAYACGGCSTQHLNVGGTFSMQILQANGGTRTSESGANSFNVTRVGN